MTDPVEEWRAIGGTACEVSDRGNVRERGGDGATRAIKASPPAHGRRDLRVRVGGRSRPVHDLVAEAFIGPKPPGSRVLHDDFDAANNVASNLRYGTDRELRQQGGRVSHSRRRSGEPAAAAVPLAVSGATVLHGDAFETAFVLLRPAALARGLVGEILARYERRLLWIAAIAVVAPSDALLREHYAGRPGGGASAFRAGRGIALLVRGPGAIAAVLAANGHDASPGTVRGDYGGEPPHDLVEASGDRGDATRAARLWFGTEPHARL